MTKEDIICSHCGAKVKWFKKCLYEITFKEIESEGKTKIYCHSCIYEIAKYRLENSNL